MRLNKLFFKYGVYYPVVFLKTKEFHSALKNLFASQYLDREEILQIQLAKTRSLLLYLKKNNTIYREQLAGLNPKDIVTIDDLRRLPFVDKKVVKERYDDFQPATMPFFCTKKTTGGSTGQAVTLLKTREAMAYELAATWRGYSWAGISIGDKQARFWGVPISEKDRCVARLTDFICNRIRLSAFCYSHDNLEAYERKIRKFNPVYYYGYVSMIEEYAKYCNNKGGYRPNNALKAIITTSEVLHESQRRLIESTFHVKVYNEYGCGEIGTIAHECEYGNMHISAENMIVEVLDGDRTCKPGEIGEIVVTELNNIAFPLIRYRLGDFATLNENECPCGRTLPILKNIHGRAYDTIQTTDGRRFHGEFFMYIFEEAAKRGYGVEKFQVIQLDLQRILIKIVPRKSFCQDKLEKLVVNYVNINLDKNIKVNFQIVDDIYRESSGKLRLIVGVN